MDSSVVGELAKKDASAQSIYECLIALATEGGVGLHLHTRNEINDKNFDIPFAFGSHLGVGARFGGNGQYELMYRYQHQSNAGLGDSNPGMNFHVLSLGLHY